MKINYLTVGELFQIKKGRKAPQILGEQTKDSKKFIQIDDLRRNEKCTIKYTVDPKGVEIFSTDIGIVWDGANAGTVGYGLNGYIGSTIALLRPINHRLVHPPYVGRFLQFKYHILNSRTTGATIPHVSKDILQAIKIPLPEINEQKRIAGILDKAEAIRRKRRQSIQLADEFLQSVFFSMFLDPGINRKKWKECKLDEISDIVSGVTKGRKFNGKKTVKIPYMRVANVQDGYLNLEDVKKIEVLPEEIEKYEIHDGDLLLTEGGDPDKLGRGFIWKGQIERCIHQNHIFRVRPNRDIVIPEFLSSLIGSSRGKVYFLKEAKQTTGVATINKTQLKNFPILLPPYSMQKKYKDIFDKYSLIKILNGSLLKVSLDLINSLSRNAFRGEL